MDKFKLVSKFKPMGDQPEAIDKLVKGFQRGKKEQTLLGVTGSGKTFTMANIIEKINKPTLVIAHNKTLAAQLHGEFKEVFPDNRYIYRKRFRYKCRNRKIEALGNSSIRREKRRSYRSIGILYIRTRIACRL